MQFPVPRSVNVDVGLQRVKLISVSGVISRQIQANPNILPIRLPRKAGLARRRLSRRQRNTMLALARWWRARLNACVLARSGRSLHNIRVDCQLQHLWSRRLLLHLNTSMRQQCRSCGVFEGIVTRDDYLCVSLYQCSASAAVTWHT